MCALHAGRGVVSDSHLTPRIGELELESEALKKRVATSDSIVVQWRKRNVGSATRVENFNTTLATSRTEVEHLDGELTTVRD